MSASDDGEYAIREAEPAEKSYVMTMMDDNMSDDTICSSFATQNQLRRCTEEEKRASYGCLRDFVLSIVGKHRCLVAIHQPSGTIVGHLVMVVVEKNSKWSEPGEVATPGPVGCLLERVAEFASLKETFERYPDQETLVRMCLLGVVREHRRKGLSRRLLKRAVDWAADEGFKLVQGIFSSVYSKRAAESVGFRGLRDFDLRRYKDERGEALFADAGENNIVSTLFLEIKQ